MATVGRTPQGTTKATVARELGPRLHKMHIQQVHNGGFVVTHHHRTDSGQIHALKTKHVFPHYAALHAHVEQTLRAHRR